MSMVRNSFSDRREGYTDKAVVIRSSLHTMPVEYLLVLFTYLIFMFLSDISCRFSRITEDLNMDLFCVILKYDNLI